MLKSQALRRPDPQPPPVAAWSEWLPPEADEDHPTAWPRNLGWIQEVAMTPERDLRGHRIALTYHTLACDLYKWIYRIEGIPEPRLALWPVNADWFNFATWATVTLNRDIRNEQTPYRSDRVLPFGLRDQLTPMVLGIKSANRQRFMQVLTWYQRLVFINTTLAYAALRTMPDDPDMPFATRSPEGRITLTKVDLDGKGTKWTDLVRKLGTPYGYEKPAVNAHRYFRPIGMAFEYYRRARQVTEAIEPGMDVKSQERIYLETLRTRLILFGNLILTAVEQDVVDPGVNRALDNWPLAAGAVAGERLADLAERVVGVPRQLAGLRLIDKLQPAQNTLTEVYVRFLTRELLVLTFPAEVLRLGRDIPALNVGEPYFPHELLDLRELPEHEALAADAARYAPTNFEERGRDNADLLNMVGVYDRSRGDGHGTGARDWRRFEERMNWAVTMLRSRIQEPTLFWPPYRNEDIRRIYDGELPLHNGDPTDFDVLGPLEGFPDLSGKTSGVKMRASMVTQDHLKQKQDADAIDMELYEE